MDDAGIAIILLPSYLSIMQVYQGQVILTILQLVILCVQELLGLDKLTL